MPFPIDLTRCLAFAPADALLRIARIPSAVARQRLAQCGLVEGDEVSWEDSTSSAVLLRKRDGGRVLVERELALLVEVEPEVRTPAEHCGGAFQARRPRSSRRDCDPALPR